MATHKATKPKKKIAKKKGKMMMKKGMKGKPKKPDLSGIANNHKNLYEQMHPEHNKKKGES